MRYEANHKNHIVTYVVTTLWHFFNATHDAVCVSFNADCAFWARLESWNVKAHLAPLTSPSPSPYVFDLLHLHGRQDEKMWSVPHNTWPTITVNKRPGMRCTGSRKNCACANICARMHDWEIYDVTMQRAHTTLCHEHWANTTYSVMKLMSTHTHTHTQPLCCNTPCTHFFLIGQAYHSDTWSAALNCQRGIPCKFAMTLQITPLFCNHTLSCHITSYCSLHICNARLCSWFHRCVCMCDSQCGWCHNILFYVCSQTFFFIQPPCGQLRTMGHG